MNISKRTRSFFIADMEILGTGIDIVEVGRVRQARYLNRVADFLLLESERSSLRESREAAQFVASRLAAKEAVIKAYPGALGYRDFSIVKDGEKLSVRFARQEHKKYKVFLSIAHEFNYAVACATVCV